MKLFRRCKYDLGGHQDSHYQHGVKLLVAWGHQVRILTGLELAFYR